MPDVSWLYGDGDVYGVTLPNGHDFPLRVDYTGKENAGVIVSARPSCVYTRLPDPRVQALIVVSSISLTAVVALLVAIVVGIHCRYHVLSAELNARRSLLRSRVKRATTRSFLYARPSRGISLACLYATSCKVSCTSPQA
jgi:hypothetical protein